MMASSLSSSLLSPESSSLTTPSASRSLLSARQQEDLRLAILDYLWTSNLPLSFDAFGAETGISKNHPPVTPDAPSPSPQLSFVADGKQRYSGLLEKKWTSVIRLQKKIMELESQMAQLKTELETASTRGPPRAAANGAATSVLPHAAEKHRLAGHRGPINKIAFHPVYSILATASDDTTIKIWDYETGTFERTVKGHTKAVNDVAYHPAGSCLLSCSADLSIKLWNVENDYECLRTMHGHGHSVSAVAFSPDGESFLTASRDSTIRLWETATGFATRTIQGHNDWVRDIAWSADGALVASCSNDQSILIWDSSTWSQISHLLGHTHVVESVAFSPLSQTPSMTKLALQTAVTVQPSSSGSQYFVASASRDKTIKLWDAISGQCIHTIIGHENWIRDIAFYPSSPYLISVSDDKSMRVWDTATGKSVKTLESHAQFVTCCAIHQSERILATASVDQTCKLWVCM
ncbi:hypothetical protein BASA50_010169 [Batrachochytrium salamandrivorans]|uniref:Nuclear distribution protein PAC1 n=1 Tax=Batrachochytrium salamandrivorans TaxID=1357716 RepID=A0ABQ8F2G7_9FUNG|nr:hypothetical protein BASA61_009705 [Batrachochytrium salamandrivorans]KAH6589294.1 hypothetical protein BASA50_010169 [Batrachochytrium salamandrivorans]KAH9258813.1 hypothetical protein BASA81_002877 [Batrachochytrium salamandrivorans]KAJ1343590.1 hypothetical protein BSLG_001859 [Batrachochytrium salamandrivorans]